MKYIEFDQSRPMDLVLLGRVAIDFNPAYNDQVKEEFKPLKKVHMFEKFVGGSPANIAVGVTRHGLKAGFIGKVSDDQFGDIIMGSREEFDLTEKLIRPGMTDEESAAYWQNCNAKIVVIKHGMQGSTAYTCDGEKFSIKPFPVEARKGFGGGDGYGSGFLYGLYQGWPIIDCLEFGSAEASMMVRSNNCSDSLPGPQEVHDFIKEEKEKFGEMIARV